MAEISAADDIEETVPTENWSDVPTLELKVTVPLLIVDVPTSAFGAFMPTPNALEGVSALIGEHIEAIDAEETAIAAMNIFFERFIVFF